MVVIDNTAAAFDELSDAHRSACLLEARRVLRHGGRVEFIERVSQGNTSEAQLLSAGFKPVRTLAERGRFRFVEGLKG
jgi:hypothetical protein